MINKLSWIQVLALSWCLVLAGGCEKLSEDSLNKTRGKNAEEDISLFRDESATLNGPLDLKQALALALKHNTQIWLARQEHKIKQEQLTGTYLKLLPKLNVDGEFSRANKLSASSSAGIDDNEQSLRSSYSREKDASTYGANAIWNVLDFGVTYLRSQQKRKELLIANYDNQRIQQRIVLDVTSAYWKAQAAREILTYSSREIKGMLDTSLERLQKQIEKQEISQVIGLKREIQLLKFRRKLAIYARKAAETKVELARVVGLPVSKKFELAKIDFEQLQPLPIKANSAFLEKYALTHRPELFSKDLEVGITHDEVLATLIQMFPAPSIFWRYNHDPDKFLYYNDWSRVGLTAAWDIFSLPGKFSKKRSLRQRQKLFERERMALAVGILTQMHIALIGYEESQRLVKVTRKLDRKHSEMIKAQAASLLKGAGHQQEVLLDKLLYLANRVEYMGTLVNMNVTYARILNSLGVEPGTGGEQTFPLEGPKVAEVDSGISKTVK